MRCRPGLAALVGASALSAALAACSTAPVAGSAPASTGAPRGVVTAPSTSAPPGASAPSASGRAPSATRPSRPPAPRATPAPRPARTAEPPPPARRLTMSPEAARADVDRRRADCYVPYEGSSVPSDCVIGDPDARTEVALVGDSHAGQWLAAVAAAAQRRGWSVRYHIKTACPVAPVRILSGRDLEPYTDCSRWRARLFSRLAGLPDLDVVVVARSRGYVGMLHDARWASLPADEVGTEWRAATRRMLARLTGSSTGAGGDGPAVVLLRDTPWPSIDIPDCLAAHRRSPTACDFPAAGHVHGDAVLWEAEQQASAGRPDVRLVDPTPWLCPGTPCRAAWTGGTVVYRDGHHMTDTFSRAQAARIGSAVERAAAAAAAEGSSDG